MIEQQHKKPQPNHTLMQLILALPISLILFGVMLLLLVLGFEVAYANRVYPGVYVQDLDLSGLTRQETDEQLEEALRYSYDGQVRFTFEDRTWDARPIDLGFRIDAESSAEKAYQVGRRGLLPVSLFDKGRAWFTGVQVSPVAFYDERVALDVLQSIAAEVNQPVTDASLQLEGAEVIAEPSQIGLEVDLPATLALLKPGLMAMEDIQLSLVVNETPPLIKDVEPQAELARRILSEPLVISVPGDDQSWSIPPEEVASMLVIIRGDNNSDEPASYRIALNEKLLETYLSSLKSGLYVEPVNTRFIFNDDTSQLEVIEPAVIGRELDVDASVEYINDEVIAGAHEVDLQFTTLKPEVTDDITAQELGITELIHQETTYFYGSESARVQNIRASSSRFHGLLVAPGETFSMVDAIGNISLDSGYAEALIIFGGRTIRAVGGGVCQVSTNLFRAAFFAGFPIEERHAHSYRVGFYEQRPDGSRDTRLAGLDATVYVPIVDMKFINDTDHWLLMETYATNTSLTWKFYSTSDGRRVEWTTTGPQNVVPAPEPLYQENPDLAKGEIKQVDYAADGADVRVNRTVYINDQVHFSDSIVTYYRPWQAIFEYGPGTEGIPESNGD